MYSDKRINKKKIPMVLNVAKEYLYEYYKLHEYNKKLNLIHTV